MTDKVTYARVTAAGKMKPIQTAAVAPVNWNASQMLGMKFAPKKIRAIRPKLIDANLMLSETKGLAEGKKSPSRFNLSGKKTMGKTSIKCAA